MTPPRWWREAWWSPADPLGLIAMRMVVSLSALWIVVSRPDLPLLRAWPPEFWAGVEPVRRARFLIFETPLGLERALWVACGVLLLLTAAGVAPRLSALLAAALLYHFGSFEEILSTPTGPYFNGFTTPILGLLVLAFACNPRWTDEPSVEWRWPVTLVRMFFAFLYVFSGISKLQAVGPVWATGQNFSGLVLGYYPGLVVPPLAMFMVRHPLLCWMGAVGGMAMDLGAIVAVFSRRAALLFIPLALVIHVATIYVFSIFFLSFPLLLLFLDWDAIARRMRKR
jgi:hypothetical protein